MFEFPEICRGNGETLRIESENPACAITNILKTFLPGNFLFRIGPDEMFDIVWSNRRNPRNKPRIGPKHLDPKSILLTD